MKKQHGLLLLLLMLLCQPRLFCDSDNPVRAELISESKSVQPGKALWVGIHFKMDEGWHTYWKNPGEVGLPNKVAWNLPDGFSAGELEWPYPKKIMEGDITAFAYENEVLLLSEIKTPGSFEGSEVALKAKVGWLACKEICLPGEADVLLTLPVRSEDPESDERYKDLFSLTRSHLAENEPGWNFKIQNSWGKIKLQFSALAQLESAEFFSLDKRVIDLAAPQEFQKTKEGYELILVRAKDFDKSKEQLQGVLVVRGIGADAKAIRVNLNL